MQSEQDQRKFPWVAAGMVISAFAAYPLSIGPLLWMLDRFSESFVVKFYLIWSMPVWWLHEQGLLPKWYLFYLEWWLDT